MLGWHKAGVANEEAPRDACQLSVAELAKGALAALSNDEIWATPRLPRLTFSATKVPSFLRMELI